MNDDLDPRQSLKTVGDLRRYLAAIDLSDNTPLLRNVEGFLQEGIEIDLTPVVAYPHEVLHDRRVILPQGHGYEIPRGEKFVGLVFRRRP